MTRIILATGNAHKVREFQDLFAAAALPWGVENADACGGMPPVVESADTFAGNALLKARALRALAPAGAWVLADDSGLEVAALGGAPGVYSSRYSGPGATAEENTAKLLRELANVPASRRAARFVCALALLAPGGAEHLFAGFCPGKIGGAPAGSGGFGYDPVFYPVGHRQTFAELGGEAKHKLSHRGRALERLLNYLRQLPAPAAAPA